MSAEEHDRKVSDLPRLDQRQRFEQFVKRAEAAREDDEREAVLHEHHLADEEIFERETQRLICVWSLFEGKLDVASDRESACFEGAAVRGFHYARAASRDDGEALFGEQRGGFLGGFVIGIVGPGSRRTEDRDAAAQRGQLVEAFDKLAHDAKDAPWIGVSKLVGPWAFE